MAHDWSHALHSQDEDRRLGWRDLGDASPRPPRRLRVQAPQITASNSSFIFDYKNYKTDGAVSRNVFWQKRLRCSGITKAEQLLAPPPFPPVFPDEDEEGWERLDVATWPGVGSCSFGILLYACSSICQFHLSLDCCMYMLCQV